MLPLCRNPFLRTASSSLPSEILDSCTLCLGFLTPWPRAACSPLTTVLQRSRRPPYTSQLTRGVVSQFCLPLVLVTGPLAVDFCDSATRPSPSTTCLSSHFLKGGHSSKLCLWITAHRLHHSATPPWGQLHPKSVPSSNLPLHSHSAFQGDC